MAESKNFGRNIFMVGIASECFETYFKTAFLGLCHFVAKMAKIVKNDSQNFLVELQKSNQHQKQNLSPVHVPGLLRVTRFTGQAKNSEKMAKSKIFGRKFFWSESIQNVSKRILNRKSQNRKFCPVENGIAPSINREYLEQKYIYTAGNF